LGSGGWSILEADGDGDDEDCRMLANVSLLGSFGCYEPATMMQAAPTQAIQLMRPRVWMLETQKVTTAAIATKIAVQAPCSDRALSATEILSMAEPETKVKSRDVSKSP
jgi:hypothetical protein